MPTEGDLHYRDVVRSDLTTNRWAEDSGFAEFFGPIGQIQWWLRNARMDNHPVTTCYLERKLREEQRVQRS